MRWFGLASITVFLMVGSALAANNEAQEAFDKLWGDQIKKVDASPRPQDAVALAGKLLEAARTSAADVPDLLALHCCAAYRLATKDASGYGVAIEAMELLAGKIPERRRECMDLIVGIRQKEYNLAKGPQRVEAGKTLVECLMSLAEIESDEGNVDIATEQAARAVSIATTHNFANKAEIKARADYFQGRAQICAKIAKLRESVKKDPNDIASRNELVRLYLVGLDLPAEAAKYLADEVDEKLRTYVPLVLKNAEDLKEAALLELGDWYKSQAEKESSFSKPALLRRAAAYYQQYLSVHTANDVTRARVEIALKAMVADGSSAVAVADITPASGWVELVKTLDPSLPPQSNWRVKGGIISMGATSCVVFPIAPTGSYEIQVKLKRTDGKDIVILNMPMGNNRCELHACGGEMYGWNRDPFIGLCQVNGKPPENNESTVKLDQSAGQANCQIDLKVAPQKDNKVDITAGYNGKQSLHWSGEQSALGYPQGFRIPSSMAESVYIRFPGKGTCQIESVRLRMLSGAAKAPRCKWMESKQPVDLLPLANAESASGQCESKDGKLTVKQGAMPFAVRPFGSYDIDLEFRSLDNNPEVDVLLPVPWAVCELKIGFDWGKKGGIAKIDGRDAWDSGNPASKSDCPKLDDKAVHRASVHVQLKDEQVDISVDLDEKKSWIHWSGKQSLLSSNIWESYKDPDNVNFRAQGSAELLSMKLKMTSGKLRVSELPPKKP